MRCENCGSIVDDRDVYCGNCGHRIERKVEVIDHTHDNDEFEDLAHENKYEQTSYVNSNTSSDDINKFSSERNNRYGTSNNDVPPRYKMKLSNSSATFALVCGILSILGVFTLITAIIGLNMANKGLQLAATGEYEGESNARVGKILSIIGLVFGLIQIFIIIISIALPIIGAVAQN